MKYTVIIILCGIFIDLKCIVKYGSKKYDYNETTRTEKWDFSSKWDKRIALNDLRL